MDYRARLLHYFDSLPPAEQRALMVAAEGVYWLALMCPKSSGQGGKPTNKPESSHPGNPEAAKALNAAIRSLEDIHTSANIVAERGQGIRRTKPVRSASLSMTVIRQQIRAGKVPPQ